VAAKKRLSSDSAGNVSNAASYRLDFVDADLINWAIHNDQQLMSGAMINVRFASGFSDSLDFSKKS
jgi:hypothetical protein